MRRGKLDRLWSCRQNYVLYAGSIPFRFARVSRPKLCTTCKLCTKDVRYMMTQQPPTPLLDFWTAHLSGRCPHSGSSMFCTMLIVSCQNDRSVRAQQRALEISGVAHSVKGRRRKRCAQQDPPSTWVDVQYVARAKVWMGRAASPQTISIPLIKVAMGGTDLQRFSRVLGICLQVSKSALQLGNLRFLRDFFYHRSCGRHAVGVYTLVELEVLISFREGVKERKIKETKHK